MRPPEFTGGNTRTAEAETEARTLGSMRPPEFTGGNSFVVVSVYVG